jgi:hypothetical protein
MTDRADNLSAAADTRPVSYYQARGSGRTWLDARDRYDELTRRDLHARSIATLKARGEYEPARHGTDDPGPLTLRERLEVLANGEVVARVHRHPYQVHHALEAGATWEQIAEATGSDEAKARHAYRELAAGQNRLWHHYRDGKFGMDDAEYAAARARAAEPEAQRLAVEPEAETGQ